MKKQGLCAAVIMAVSGLATAGSYQAEVAGKLGSYDVDGGDSSTVLGARGALYFAPVDTAGKPLAEAAFLSRAANVKAAIDFINGDNFDTTTTNLGVEVYIPRSIIYLGVDYNRVDTDNWDDSYWTVTGGVTPIDGLLVTTTYNEEAGYDLNVAAKYVAKLGGQQAVNFYGSFVDNDENSYTAGFDFYFNRQASLGLEITDAGSNTTYTFKGDYFFTETFFAGVYYANADSSDAIGAEVGLRF